MTEAIHSDRNSGSPSGAQGEAERRVGIGATIGILAISAMKACCWSYVCPIGRKWTSEAPASPLTNYGVRKRPLLPSPRPQTKNNDAHDKNHRCVPDFF